MCAIQVVGTYDIVLYSNVSHNYFISLHSPHEGKCVQCNFID